MRSGGACTVQQTLTNEAASVLKHSLSLARRRGHAQVTPLHVAATLLMSSRATLLKRACLKSSSSSPQPLPNYQNTLHHHHHHHPPPPLQCRALELCFNVALNRLPTTPGPLLHGQPNLSNALIAALKRAQAHQRRGCIENQQVQQQQQQQQPLLAIKVELEQLILSILDDPSVSRVMREAGFSSTAVKNNLEDINLTSPSPNHLFFSGGGVYSSPSSPNSSHVDQYQYHHHHHSHNHNSFWQTHFLNHGCEQNPVFVSPQKGPTVSEIGSLKEEDMSLVMEVMLGKNNSKKRNTIIVGDSVGLTEGLVVDLMGKVERGEVPNELKSAHFIKFQFSSLPLRFMKREEVEMNLSDLKNKVESLCVGDRGVIIYAGDLKWTVDEREGGGGGGGYYGNPAAAAYSPVDHLVGEIGRLISSEYSSKKIWVMGTANYQTYMKCKMKQPSLETQWALQAVSVPSGGLRLSLNATSVQDSRISLSNSPSQLMDRKPFTSKDEANILTCCVECTSNYDKEAALFKSSSTTHLDKPSTLLPYWLQKDDLAELRRKWNRLCQSLHQGRNTQNSSVIINNYQQGIMGKSYSYNSSYPVWPNQSNSISFGDSTLKPNHHRVASSFPRFRRQQSCHIELSFSNGGGKNQVGVEPNLDLLKSREEGKEVKITLALGNSLSSSDCGKEEEEISKCLLDNVPWQSETIASIVKVLANPKSKRKDVWLMIEGNDSVGKRRLGLAIAEAVFGSVDLFLCMSMGNTEIKLRESSSELLERALRNQENLVVLVEDVDLGDAQFVKFLGDGFESGKFGENGQRIFILTKGDHYYNNKKPNHVVKMNLQVCEMNSQLAVTPNSDHKRKAEWDLSSSEIKISKISSFSKENENKNKNKKDLSRQSSSNTLDLNIKVNDDDDEIDEVEECSPNSSDLTRETGTNFQTPFDFLDLIKHVYVFNGSSSKDSVMKEVLSNKIKGAFEEVFGSENMELLAVEGGVLEEVLLGFGTYLESLFEKWLKDVFQTSLQTVKIGGKQGMGIRVCLGEGNREMGKGGNGIQEEEGFMGSNLPKEIKVCFMY